MDTLAGTARVESLNGMAATADGGYLVVIPHDGEWLFGLGEDLDELVDAMLESDGRAFDEGGYMGKPYLTQEDAVAELESYLGRKGKIVVDATLKATAPTA